MIAVRGSSEAPRNEAISAFNFTGLFSPLGSAMLDVSLLKFDCVILKLECTVSE